MEGNGPLETILANQKSTVRWAMIAVFVLLTAFIMPKYYRAPFSYEPGRPWTGPDLVAEFPFAKYKSQEEFEADKRKALATVTPVFLFDEKARTAALGLAQKRLEDFIKETEGFAVILATGSEESKETRRREIIEKFGVDPSVLWAENPFWDNWKATFPNRLNTVVRKLYDNYVADTAAARIHEFPGDRILIRHSSTEGKYADRRDLLSPGGVQKWMEREAHSFTPSERELTSRLLLGAVQPNVVFDVVLTRKEREKALNRVSEIYGKVNAGEIIVARGQQITGEVDVALKSYMRISREKFGSTPYWLTLIGQLALMTIITFMLVLYLRTNRPRIFYRNRKLGMVLLLYLMATGLLVLALKIKLNTWEEYKLNYAFMAPVCMVPLVLTVFFDGRFGTFGNIIIALVGGSIVPNGFEYFFVQMIGGTVAVYSLGKLRNRSSFFISLSYILTAYAGAFVGYSFYVSSGFTAIHYGNLLLLLVNVILTFLTWLVIYLFEKMFGLTSDLTFVELLDTNHPLLKELSIRAPGTFQHSLQVANIAEAVVNRIGGNSLKAKVGALFHDVGKLKSPQYFVENFMDDHNPHDEMDPEESARVIIAHVSDGVKLAREHNLPSEVVDFIRTHHGTSRTEYFYRHYKDEHPGEVVPEANFHYPGPLPFTREMAVVMIADSVEAATRAMKEHSPEKMKELVLNMVDSKVRQNQFINVNLTFRDLEDIKQVIYLQLVTMYHERVEYPEEKEA